MTTQETTGNFHAIDTTTAEPVKIGDYVTHYTDKTRTGILTAMGRNSLGDSLVWVDGTQYQGWAFNTTVIDGPSPDATRKDRIRELCAVIATQAQAIADDRVNGPLYARVALLLNNVSTLQAMTPDDRT